MAFNVSCQSGIYSTPLICLPNDSLLAFGARTCDSPSLAVPAPAMKNKHIVLFSIGNGGVGLRIHSCSSNNRSDWISVLDSICQSLDIQGASTIGSRISISSDIKSMTS